MIGPDRIPCLVAGCRRSAPRSKYPPGTEIICAQCWRLVPRRLKRRVRRVERIMKRAGVTGWDHPGDPGSIGRRALVVHGAVWRAIKVALIEARAGI